MKIIIPPILLFLIALIGFFGGGGGRREEIATVVFVSFAWGSVYRFPFVFFVALFWNREWFNTMTGIWGLLILVQDIGPQNSYVTVKPGQAFPSLTN